MRSKYYTSHVKPIPKPRQQETFKSVASCLLPIAYCLLQRNFQIEAIAPESRQHSEVS
ncbi:hypothetical protein [Nostoc sp. CCY 9925]|uniref:hypothetical protein n=1 Tax=Nostoc sp. CCY 9925 TaxID=3103865 RepID=UPI0039C65873